jgi:hypothetical protein
VLESHFELAGFEDVFYLRLLLAFIQFREEIEGTALAFIQSEQEIEGKVTQNPRKYYVHSKTELFLCQNQLPSSQKKA